MRLARAVPANVRAVCERLVRAGHQAVTVGGAVRDAMLGRAPGDWDVATSAHPDQVLALFPRTVATGLKHGTVTVVTGRGAHSHVEVTTFRGEGAYTDARRPDHVVFGVPLVEDLARRDLRVNAMAYDPLADRLIDPYGGLADLADRVLRAVGPTGDVYQDAVARFSEDGLRVMRAVRFAAQLEFALDPDTERGIGPALPSLARVSKERICDELRKILAAAQPSRALAIAERAGIVALILPELVAGLARWASWLAGPGAATADGSTSSVADPTTSSDGSASRWLAAIDASAREARLGALLADLAPPDPTCRRLDRDAVRRAEDALRRLKFANDEIALASTLVGATPAITVVEWTDPDVRRILGDITRPRAAAAVSLWRARGASALADRAAAVLAAGDPLAIGELALNGGDLIRALELTPGPAVGRILVALLERAFDDPAVNTRDQLIDIARGLELSLAR